MTRLRTTLVFLIILSPSVLADRLIGKVVSISDGDTLTLLTLERVSHKVRLAEIDAPEKGQPWGNNSKTALSELIFNQIVQIETTEKDRYGRVIGTVYLAERNVNKLMVERGHAWAYTRYVKDRNYLSLQETAKSAGIGLWSLSDNQIIAPWEFRRK